MGSAKAQVRAAIKSLKIKATSAKGKGSKAFFAAKAQVTAAKKVAKIKISAAKARGISMIKSAKRMLRCVWLPPQQKSLPLRRVSINSLLSAKHLVLILLHTLKPESSLSRGELTGWCYIGNRELSGLNIALGW